MKLLKVAFVLLLAVTATALISIRLFLTGAVGFDDWVMRQVLGVVQTYLVPTIEFDRFEFAPPGTVTYHGVRLIAPDTTRVVDAGELVITLGKVPRHGEPILIQGVTVRDGSLHLIADNNDPDTRFKGLVPFVKRDNIKKQDKLPREVRLSETLDLRTITLENAGIVYDPDDGQPPMRLDAVTMTMNIDRRADDAGVWHSVGLDIDRGALFGLVLDGRINLDDLAMELKTLRLRVDVGSDSVAALPPQVQQILADHDAHGELEIDLTGAASFEQWRQSELQGEIALNRFNFGLSDYRLPIDKGALPIKVGGGTATLGPMRFKMLEGDVHATMSADLQQQDLPAVAEWSIAGLNIRELLRTANPDGQPPKIAGILGSFGSATMGLTGLPETLGGRGEIHITDGYLLNFPGVRELNSVVDVVSMVRGDGLFSDRFDAKFTITDKAIRVDQSKLETNAINARGTGLVYYNQRLDLSINAGPLEKLENLLGRVGGSIGRLFEKALEYRVTGTISDPEITVRPLGIGF